MLIISIFIYFAIINFKIIRYIEIFNLYTTVTTGIEPVRGTPPDFKSGALTTRPDNLIDIIHFEIFA